MKHDSYAPGAGMGAPAPFDTPDERKRIATVTARAALVGLVLRPLADGMWQVLNQFGQPATVQSLQAAEALVYGCELVRADVAALMSRLRPAAGEGARHE